MPRDRLCELAGVDRGKHRRWIDDKFVPERHRYREIDLIWAAVMDELNRHLKRRRATVVFRRIRDELGIPGKRLEVVVELATLEPTLVRSARELDSAIARGEQVVVIDLAGRVRPVVERFRAYLDGLRDPAPEDGEASRGLSELQRTS